MPCDTIKESAEAEAVAGETDAAKESAADGKSEKSG